ncbi:RICIN domain-containing protein [Nocardioides bruguierae]|uniref:RICIN domain-containing protein n=1 Tax=Nocardioides bruguierae TaxID=2945102 RepID=UPI002020A46D|nr:RICIN domain-containing protein [Nocardioides bruguierae]MCL8025314.1 RICIN domain-containing protein [Nocardioides bruguierae]
MLALLAPGLAAQAYAPVGGVLYQLPDGQDCLKGLGNCAVYPKAVQLPGGRLVAAFERSTVQASGSAVGQTMPVYASDDDGSSWYPLSEVAPPADLSSAPEAQKYTSNWTNPYLYVMPETVGSLAQGTLVLASVVSGDDYYYLEHKAADPSWTPSNDGDRKDVGIALFASTDEGASWDFVNVVAAGGWQGGSAGATGQNIADANTHAQVDPVWEPYLMVRDGVLVAYYSDENDYVGYDPVTGVAQLDPDNDTAPDTDAQILAHRTWDGTSAAWSAPVVDVAGTTFTANGKQMIGGGRPGMANVVPTTDGRWMLTYEYWGGGANVRFKMADDPLRYFADGDPVGQEISRGDGAQGALPYADGSQGLSWGGSPVTIALPDGRLVYNASGSGDVWVNPSGRSDGTWTQMHTTLGSGYSRNLTYDATTGRVVILQGVWGGATTPAVIRYADVDLGGSAGTYYQVTNRATGLVIGTGGNITDADLGNSDTPDVRLEQPGATSVAATQWWHLVTKDDGGLTLLNKAGGRAASIWTGNATDGQRIGQWVDDRAGGLWDSIPTTNGYVKLRSRQSPTLFLTAGADGDLRLAPATGDGSQEWSFSTTGITADTTAPQVTASVTGRTLTLTAADAGSGVASIEYRPQGKGWSTYTGPVTFKGGRSLSVEHRATDAAGNVSPVGTVVVP